MAIVRVTPLALGGQSLIALTAGVGCLVFVDDLIKTKAFPSYFYPLETFSQEWGLIFVRFSSAPDGQICNSLSVWFLLPSIELGLHS